MHGYAFNIGDLLRIKQQAIDKTAPYYETEHPDHMNIEYVANIIA